MSRGQAGRAAQSAKCLCVTCQYGAAMRSIHLDAFDRPAVLPCRYLKRLALGLSAWRAFHEHCQQKQQYHASLVAQHEAFLLRAIIRAWRAEFVLWARARRVQLAKAALAWTQGMQRRSLQGWQQVTATGLLSRCSCCSLLSGHIPDVQGEDSSDLASLTAGWHTTGPRTSCNAI